MRLVFIFWFAKMMNNKACGIVRISQAFFQFGHSLLKICLATVPGDMIPRIDHDQVRLEFLEQSA